MSTFKIRHITRYTYEQPVRDSANQIMLYPMQDDFQDMQQQSVVISGNPMVNLHTDYYGNQVGTFTHAHPHQNLTIDSQLIVITHPRSMPEDRVPAEVQWKELTLLGNNSKFIDFLKQERFESLPDLAKVVEAERCKPCTPLEMAKHLCQYVFDTFTYRKGITTVETTVDEIWNLKSGVCQDFAHVLLVMLRIINIPARYVSGYICPNKSGMRGEGATHAWVEAYVPSYGWLGLDPTNNCVVNDTHVRLAVGKNFADCSPVRGTYRGTSNHTLEVSVSVSYEDGRISSEDSETMYTEPPVTSVYRNSFSKHQEMQQQQ